MTELIIKVDDDFLQAAKLKGMESQYELVRCKDCRYADWSPFGKAYCMRNSSYGWDEDSFCSDGKREET